MKTVVVLSNHPTWTYKLRGEVLSAIVNAGYRVIVAVGNGPEVKQLMSIGCEHVNIPYNRRGINPYKEILLFLSYRKLLRELRPDAVLTYTIKPNLYGAYLCNKLGIPCLVNITGLGSALEHPGFSQSFFLLLYRLVFKKAYKIFFQNTYNRNIFIRNRIVNCNDVLLPGSGVNLQKYQLLNYPSCDTVEFVFISRILKAKGIEEYLLAAQFLHNKYSYVRFHLCGFCDQDYTKLIGEMVEKGIIIDHGMVEDTCEIYQNTHCTVLPSWYSEGMNNVLLESSACGRPVITTNRPGCGEIVDDGINGFIVKAQNAMDLKDKMERFILLPNERKKEMGIAGRKKVEKQFDRKIVIEKYLEALKGIA